MSDSGFQLVDDAAEAYERHVRVFMAPLVEVLLDRAEVGPGQAVLDLACGTGFVSRSAAARVGGDGRVVGADVNAGMLAVAERTSTSAAVSWVHTSADDLPFESNSFDRVVAQQGVQFFPDLDTALAEMARVTAPGGVVAATAWTPIETSPYFDAQYTALADAFGTHAVESLAAAFGLTDDRLRDAWTRAGLSDVLVTQHAPEVELPPLTSYVAQQLAATPWGPLLAEADPHVRDHVVTHVVQALRPWTTGDVVRVPFSTHVITGRR